MKTITFSVILAAFVAGLSASTDEPDYSADYPVSVVVVASGSQAAPNDVIDVHVEVRNRSEAPVTVPDPGSLELGFEHIPGDGNQLVVYTHHLENPPAPKMVSIDGLSSRTAIRKFRIPAEDGIVVIRVVNWRCIPSPVRITRK